MRSTTVSKHLQNIKNESFKQRYTQLSLNPLGSQVSVTIVKLMQRSFIIGFPIKLYRVD